MIEDFAPPVLIPIAALLFRLHQVGLLSEKAGIMSPDVPKDLRCSCGSPRTRIKSLNPIAVGLGPIVGFEGRCRRCGRLVQYFLDESEWAAA